MCNYLQEKSEWESLKQPEDEAFYEFDKRPAKRALVEYFKQAKACKVNFHVPTP